MGRSSPLQALKDNKTHLVTWLGIALYVIGSLIYLELGQTNADEGWYLYASKLVFRGALPYLDFAYTQMPLLPYVYGVPQLIHPSLLLGRLTSIVISLGTLLMSVVIARRYGGARSSAMTALLLGAFTFGVYFNSIVKTYALVSFFFTATLFVLSSDLRDQHKYPLALVCALAAALVRITAVFFAAPILLYAWIAAPRAKTRALILAETLLISLGAAFFLIPDWPAARWNLLDSHLSHWGASPILDRLREVVTTRLPDIVRDFGPALVLCAAALLFILHSQASRTWWRNRMPLLVTASGLVLFAASHLANGIWDVEYLVPALTTLLLLLAIALSHFFTETESASHAFLQGALVAVLLMLPLGESTQHTDLSAGRLPLTEVDQVAAIVAQNSQTDDRVLALEALDVVVDADRSVLPGMTLAQFSLQDMDTAVAQRLHVVNYELVAEAINQKAARVIVLTDADLGRLNQADPSDSGGLQRALDQNYRQVFAMAQFGQYDENVYVYLSR